MAYRNLSEALRLLQGAVSASSLAPDNPPMLPAPAGPAGPDSLGAAASSVTRASGAVSAELQHAIDSISLPPWLFPPGDSVPFDPVGSIATPGAVDTVVLTLVAPPGHDGTVRRLSHNYTGAGLAPGSGGIIWRILINGLAVRNYDAMLVEFGSPQWPRDIDGIRVKSGDVLQYVVNAAGGGGFVPAGGTFIVCGFGGWFYPREGSGQS